MRALLVVALLGLVGCGGADDQDRAVQAPKTGASPTEPPPGNSKPVSAPDPAARDSIEEARRGCVSFTEAVHAADSNDVYDPRTPGALQVYVGAHRYSLSLAVQECRNNPVAMERLKMSLPPSTEYAVRHVVYTHCGVLSTTTDVLWLADPPLPGPPSGWDENETLGDFRLTDSMHAVFTADTGVQATFTKAEPGAADPAASCE